jgi:four helix bundle protein
MPVQSYRDLLVWQKSLDFIEEAYTITRWFPADERYALTGQLRRASVSVASNIAEGSGRFTSRDYLNFLSQSRGSVKEAESDLFVAIRLRFITAEKAARALGFADEISRMLFQLRGSIRTHARIAGS